MKAPTRISPNLLPAGLTFVLTAIALTPATYALPANGKIAFATNRDGNFEIYVMNANGSNQTRLTNVAGFDMDPTWSPDGKKIAFRSSRSGRNQLYIMNGD